MIRKILFLTAMIAAPSFASSEARAADYCREYTKTVSVGGRAERAYGTACLRPDGSWEIVSLEGSNYARDKVRNTMYDDIERQTNYRDRERVVIRESYHRAPRYYKPHHRYQSVSYNSWPFVFHLGNTNHYQHKAYNKRHYNHGKKHYKQAKNNHAKKRHVKNSKPVKNRGNHYGHRYSQEHLGNGRRDRH